LSTLYIAEFNKLLVDADAQSVLAPNYPALREQVVAIGGASTQSVMMGSETRFVQLSTDVVCSFVVGVNPTATTTNSRMAANETRFIGIVPGLKIAVISNS
jgi:hypothetical protein